MERPVARARPADRLPSLHRVPLRPPRPQRRRGAGPDRRGRSDAGWAFWTDSDARSALAGLALDGGRAWALSELTRAEVVAAAEDGRLVTVHGGGTRGLALRTREYDREGADEDHEDHKDHEAGDVRDDTDGGCADPTAAAGPVTWAEYGVGAWADPAAARALCRAVARDAADAGADRIRLFLPEGVRWASDAAAARVALADAPDFVLSADLSDPAVGREGREAQGT